MHTAKKVLVLLALALGACRADNRSSISILGRAAPSSADDCKFAAGGEFRMGGGVLDVGPAYAGYLRYEIPLYVNNELADPVDSSSATVSSAKTWYAQAAKVRVNPASYVNDLRPSPALLDFQAQNVIPLDGQAIPVAGDSVQLVEVVSHELGVALRGAAVPGELRRVVLGISLQGRTADGLFLETAEWFYPLEICVGCLECVGCTGTIPLCPAGTVTTSSCGGPGQDTATACVVPE